MSRFAREWCSAVIETVMIAAVFMAVISGFARGLRFAAEWLGLWR